MQAYKKIKALGTEIEFYLQSDEAVNFENDLLEQELVIYNFQDQFSRFLDNSELSLLNQSQENFKVSPAMLKILLLAKDFHKNTGGIFDPTILRTLENQGYDKSFDSADFNRELRETQIEKIDFSQIVIDEKNSLVSRPQNLKIDLGGIGKGYVVDVIVQNLKDKGYKNFWISAGGDMYLSGRQESTETFEVGVQNPLELEKDLYKLRVIDKAVATSGIAKRQWQKNGETVNHIIDPRSGNSVSNDLLAVTIITDSAVKADIYAKIALILGREAGLEFINNQENTEGLIINKNLELDLSTNMNKYLIKI